MRPQKEVNFDNIHNRFLISFSIIVRKRYTYIIILQTNILAFQYIGLMFHFVNVHSVNNFKLTKVQVEKELYFHHFNY